MEHIAVATRSPRSCSQITNRSQLRRGVDGRSAESRRFRDLTEGFAADFGSTPPGEREMALIRQAAAVTVQAEAMQAAILRGEAVDPDQLVRLTNIQTRTLKELAAGKRRAQKSAPTLREYLAGKHQEVAR